MKEYKKILGAITVFIAIVTLGGLGNIAVKESIYWVPFILDIPFFVYICYNLFKTEKIVSGTGSGAALPAQGENEKVDNIVDDVTKKVQTKKKTSK